MFRRNGNWRNYEVGSSKSAEQTAVAIYISTSVGRVLLPKFLFEMNIYLPASVHALQPSRTFFVADHVF
jgi:hypothetical protein